MSNSHNPAEVKMQFGNRIRVLRASCALTQQQLADRMGVSVSYISKVENERLHFGDYPSSKFIHKLAVELRTDEDELLLLADKIPAAIHKRIRQRPGFFRKIAALNDLQLDELETKLGRGNFQDFEESSQAKG
jgi:transcriptional regulator with XRE-family HTH domain